MIYDGHSDWDDPRPLDRDKPLRDPIVTEIALKLHLYWGPTTSYQQQSHVLLTLMISIINLCQEYV